MTCPNCGTNNIAEANFCRMCGLNFQRVSTCTASNSTPPDLGSAFNKLFVGLAFLIVAFVPLAEGEPIVWWLLFPGIPMVMKGICLLARIKRVGGIQNHYQSVPINTQTTPIPARHSCDVRARPTGELVPISVTENTTKLL